MCSQSCYKQFADDVLFNLTESPKQDTPRTKRTRQMLSADQKDVLNRFFVVCQYPSKLQVSQLAEHLDLSLRKVGYWFTDKRTSTKKRYMKKLHQLDNMASGLSLPKQPVIKRQTVNAHPYYRYPERVSTSLNSRQMVATSSYSSRQGLGRRMCVDPAAYPRLRLSPPQRESPGPQQPILVHQEMYPANPAAYPRLRLSPPQRESPGPQQPIPVHQEMYPVNPAAYPRLRLSPPQRERPGPQQPIPVHQEMYPAAYPRLHLSPPQRESPAPQQPIPVHQEMYPAAYPRLHLSPPQRESPGPQQPIPVHQEMYPAAIRQVLLQESHNHDQPREPIRYQYLMIDSLL